MMEEIKTLRINGVLLSAPATSTILDAALENGLSIPTLCRFAGLQPVGACRLCLVEIMGRNRLQPACTTLVEEGMVIQTDTPRLQKYRRMIIELLLSEGNHDCGRCEADGTCELQSLADRLGADKTRFGPLRFRSGKDTTHEHFLADRSLCVLCTRCVRVCGSVEKAHTLNVASRGAASFITADLGSPWGSSRTCTSCGKCVRACPTGALMERPRTSGATKKNKSASR
ncbi:MAG: 2Fe-2S iron-sulfur cluster-binding protein [Bacteroidota bacterium]|nr:2Fe-2S iron-sulfur cluster-binding protein [Bacteroidota bacterium]